MIILWFYTNVQDKKIIWEINDNRPSGGTLGADLDPFTPGRLLTCGGDKVLKLYDTTRDKRDHPVKKFGNADRYYILCALSLHSQRIIVPAYNLVLLKSLYPGNLSNFKS